MAAKRKKRRLRKSALWKIILLLIAAIVICLSLIPIRFIHEEKKQTGLFAPRSEVHLDLTEDALQDPVLTDGLAEELNSRFAFVKDIGNNTVLLSRQGSEKMYPASMTKILTAIVAIEHLNDLDQHITLTPVMFNDLAEASVAGFWSGEEPTVRELLYGVALPSGADAANALAITVAGSLEDFADMMNEKAQEIGMKDSHFVTVTGMHDPEHYSTCEDMAKLLTYCIKNETFAEIFSAEKYTTEPLLYHPQGLELVSTFRPLINDDRDAPGLIGGKTGFTYPAGRCLAFWAEYHGMKLVGITGLADDARIPYHVDDMSHILNYFDSWSHRTLVQEGDIFTEYTVHTHDGDQIYPLTVPETLEKDLPDETAVRIEHNIPAEFHAELYDQNYTGQLVVYQDDVPVSIQEISFTVPAEDNKMARFRMWIDQKIEKFRNR